MITMITNDYKVTVIKVQEIEKKWRGNLIKTMELVKFRFPPSRNVNVFFFSIPEPSHDLKSDFTKAPHTLLL